jgi:hypothetical protein
MTPAEIVARAKSCLGHRVTYALGKGGMRPEGEFPWASQLGANDVPVLLCDCSGFAMWCCGLSRFQPPHWYDTTFIVADAKNDVGLFEMVPWEMAQGGDLLVYPDRRGTDGKVHQGHVGVVTDAHEGPLTMIDCSLGSYRNHGDAIIERGPTPFSLHLLDTIVARLIQPTKEAA